MVTNVREISAGAMDEYQFAIDQRGALAKVLTFLQDNDADEDMLAAVRQAIDDNDQYIDTELTVAGSA